MRHWHHPQVPCATPSSCCLNLHRLAPGVNYCSETGSPKVHVLVDVVRTNDALASKGAITRFHSKQPPPLEIRAYLER